MIDAPGRAEVVALLESLAAGGITVVHVTHREAEAAKADSVDPHARRAGGCRRRGRSGRAHAAHRSGRCAARLGRDGSGRAAPDAIRAEPPDWSSADRERSFLRVRELGYVYANGTPWARRALEGVDLDLSRGEGIVITGDNGSGKSTLAWILAGLSTPTEGEALLEGQPIVAGTGAVGISFQHARLQLIRPTVLADVAYGAGRGPGGRRVAIGRAGPRDDGAATRRRALRGRAAAGRPRRPARPRSGAARARRALRRIGRRGAGRAGRDPRPAASRAGHGDRRRLARPRQRRAAR